ncbi:recombinase family protein [Sphingomonas sp.]|uniref:recombinase family protein n=1 Tax=Sphingomonas sp. TaxID=28214 RepID=UPI001B00D798|nr:recombinase family protein [Sphingomonas sp.]MBO9712689.1 recombinase family protein [Sphingomonas sp.]
MVFETAGAPPRTGKGSVKIGYIRVSKETQNPDMQARAMRKAGCHRVFREKISATAVHRPQLARALECLNKGDQLVVWKLDRFGRDLLEYLLLQRELGEIGASLISLTENLRTADIMDSLMGQQRMLWNEVELHNIRLRTRAGLAAAKERGVKLGRKRKLSERQASAARRLMDSGMKAEAVAQKYGVGRATLFRYMRSVS